MENLEKEIKCFYKIQTELVANNPGGGFVVIKENNVLGVWLNRMDAIKAAVETYGNVSFLVKNINDSTMEFINFSRPINFCHAVSYSS